MSEKPSILIVEDEYLPGIHLKTILAREGYEVFGPATNSADAERLIRGKDPRIILLDIRLAGNEDGIELARRLGGFSTARIIFMSGYQESAFRDRAMEVGPLAFLVKPVMLKDITAVIDRFEGN